MPSCTAIRRMPPPLPWPVSRFPNCVLPEVEVFLGEVPTARYETPGGSRNSPKRSLPHRQEVQHDHPGQSRHRDLRPDPGKRLLQHRNHRRLLQDPDPGPAARQGELLHDSRKPRSCSISRRGWATTIRASRARTATCAQQHIRPRLQRSARASSEDCEPAGRGTSRPESISNSWCKPSPIR